jgi:hypothetical protein
MQRQGVGKMQFARHWLKELGPYQSLVILSIPVAIVEPLKIGALAIVGTGHWLTGTLVMIFSYAFSLLIIERVFKIVRPKLLTLKWFAAFWNWFTAIRAKTMAIFKSCLPI